jgi:hypothetical protein
VGQALGATACSIQFISIGDEEEPIEWVSDCWVMVEKTGFI